MSEKSASKSQLYEVAKAQKIAMWMIAGMLLGGLGLRPIGMLFGVVGMAFLARALQKRYVFLWALGMFIPFGNIVLMIIVNNDATIFLRKHGIRVGFLGADMKELKTQSANTSKPIHPKPRKKRDLWGDVIETKEEAEKVIQNSSLFFYIIGLMSIVAGFSISIAYAAGGVLLLIPAFFLRQKKSRTAAVLILLLECAEIAVRVESGANGLLFPIIGIWFGIKAVQATFLWHKFKKKHSGHSHEKIHSEAETTIA
ncbi:MAG: hypothetical protein KBD00_00645 [Candidatus Peribacteraceae bacterium]|nr:hypothetical protein [Candidatus Peribacteraceae bacterium]